MRVIERCYYCDRKLSRKNKTVDHLVPLSKGGTDDSTNRVYACRTCNQEKGCLSVNEFRAVIAYRLGVIRKPRMSFPGEIRKRDRELL